MVKKKEDKVEDIKDDSAKYVQFKKSNKSKTLFIHDGVREKKYVLVRWQYGEELDAMSTCTKLNRRTGETEFDAFEYTLIQIEKTVRKPKLTRADIIALDPRVGKELASECQTINNPDVDFTSILAKLPKSQ